VHATTGTRSVNATVPVHDAIGRLLDAGTAGVFLRVGRGIEGAHFGWRSGDARGGLFAVSQFSVVTGLGIEGGIDSRYRYSLHLESFSTQGGIT
jgi:hypothetical protein